jgi:hypothetical protein
MLSWNPWKIKIYLYLLDNANTENNVWKNIPIRRGQLIRSPKNIGNEVAYIIKYKKMMDRQHNQPSASTVRRILEDLEVTKLIKCEVIKNATLITICNYDTIIKMPMVELAHADLAEVKTVVDNSIYNTNNNYHLTSILVLNEAYEILANHGEDAFLQFCKKNKLNENDITAIRQKISVQTTM